METNTQTTDKEGLVKSILRCDISTCKEYQALKDFGAIRAATRGGTVPLRTTDAQDEIDITQFFPTAPSRCYHCSQYQE